MASLPLALPLPRILAAPTTPDPYPFYAELRARRPFGFDEELGAFVAADAASVRAVLADPRFRVRPLLEPIPPPLAGSPAGELFARLVRMDDSPAQARRKAAILAALGGRVAARIEATSLAWARRLVALELPLSELAFRLPIFALGDLLGLPAPCLPRVEELIGDWVCCLAPGARATEIEAGKRAAAELLAFCEQLLDAPASGEDGLLAELARGMPEERPAILANGIGLLMQAYEATAGLIANSLLVLMRSTDLRQDLLAGPGRIAAMVRETARWDPPVQNTRRFAAEAFSFLDHEIEAGQMVLLLLAAANRDPAIHARPDEFDLERAESELASFGHGAHACPGRRLAEKIAVSALEALAEAGALPAELLSFTYHSSQNTRIPLFDLSANGSLK